MVIRVTRRVTTTAIMVMINIIMGTITGLSGGPWPDVALMGLLSGPFMIIGALLSVCASYGWATMLEAASQLFNDMTVWEWTLKRL